MRQRLSFTPIGGNIKSYISTQTIYLLMIYRNSHFYPVTWIYRKCRSFTVFHLLVLMLKVMALHSLGKLTGVYQGYSHKLILISNKEK